MTVKEQEISPSTVNRVQAICVPICVYVVRTRLCSTNAKNAPAMPIFAPDCHLYTSSPFQGGPSFYKDVRFNYREMKIMQRTRTDRQRTWVQLELQP